MDLAGIDTLIDSQLTSLPGWCTYDKAKRLVRIASESGVSHAVEIGVHGGRSLISLALGFKLAGKGTIDGIDSYSFDDCMEAGTPEQDQRPLWSTMDFALVFDRATDGLQRFGVAEVARIIRKRADDAVSDYTDGALGLIHLDGNHSTLVSCRDVKAWMPKMAPKATWISDDTNWPSMQPALQLIQSYGFRLVEAGSEGYWSVFARG